MLENIKAESKDSGSLLLRTDITGSKARSWRRTTATKAHGTKTIATDLRSSETFSTVFPARQGDTTTRAEFLLPAGVRPSKGTLATRLADKEARFRSYLTTGSAKVVSLARVVKSKGTFVRITRRHKMNPDIERGVDKCSFYSRKDDVERQRGSNFTTKGSAAVDSASSLERRAIDHQRREEVAEYRDKFWVVNQIRKALETDNDLSDYFDWLLQVWNTNRDYEFPSLNEYNPDEEDET